MATAPAPLDGLTREIEDFHANHAEIGIDQPNVTYIMSNSKVLVDKVISLLLEWRHRSNYPSLRGNENDVTMLDSFQDAFSSLHTCIMSYQNKLDMQANIAKYAAEGAEMLCSLLEKLKQKSWVVETNPCQTNKMKQSKTAGMAEDKLVVKFRCLLPQLWPEPKKLQFSVRDLESASGPCTGKLDKPQITSETSDSTRYERNRITLTSMISGVKPMKKTDANLYVIRGQFGPNVLVETLPFGFYTHTTQIPILSGHIVWFNAFAETEDPCLTGLTRPGSVEANQILAVLDEEFHGPDSVLAKSMKSTNKPKRSERTVRFKDYNETCLLEMLGYQRNNPTPIVKDAFLKTKIDHERKTTFWEWFYACCKTKCEYLPDLYQQGLLYGFLTKCDAEELLLRRSQGEPTDITTLIIRFSTKFLDGHHAYISPSISRIRGKVDHGNPIKSSKYKTEEKKLGRVLLTQMGEIEEAKVKVLTLHSEKPQPFDEVFKDFMEETEVFSGYEDLNRELSRSVISTNTSMGSSMGAPNHVPNAPSPSPSDLSLTGANNSFQAQQLEDSLGQTLGLDDDSMDLTTDQLLFLQGVPDQLMAQDSPQGNIPHIDVLFSDLSARPRQVDNGGGPMDINIDEGNPFADFLIKNT